MALYEDMPDAFPTCDFATRDDLEANIAVGSTVLVRDENRRIYRRSTEGTATGGSLERGHYRKETVVAETSRSWVLGDAKRGRKVPKKTLEGVYSNLCADRASWVRSHGHKIVDELQRLVWRRDHKAFAACVELAVSLGVDLPEPPQPAGLGVPCPGCVKCGPPILVKADDGCDGSGLL